MEIEWQTIDTAEKSPVPIWLASAPLQSIRIGCWKEGEGWVDQARLEQSLADPLTLTGLHFEPTHWAPLPFPPKDKEQ